MCTCNHNIGTVRLSWRAFSAVFDVVRKLPETGVQAKLQRKTWPPESFWTVTAVQPTVVQRQSCCMPPLSHLLQPDVGRVLHAQHLIITHMSMPCVPQDGHHGKAWGIFTWKGKARNEQPTRVRGTLKKVWRVYGDPAPTIEWRRLPSAAPQNASTAGEAAAQMA